MKKLNLHKISTVKYYSFYVARTHLKKSDWILYDLKIPALNVKQAIYFFMFLKHEKYKIPTRVQIGDIRGVIEFELIEARGLTIFQFKQTHVFLSHHFEASFKT